MSEFTQLLEDLICCDHTLCSAAEARIKKCFDENPNQLILDLIAVLEDDSKKQDVRHLAALLIRNCLTRKDHEPEKAEAIWQALPASTKDLLLRKPMDLIASAPKLISTQASRVLARVLLHASDDWLPKLEAIFSKFIAAEKADDKTRYLHALESLLSEAGEEVLGKFLGKEGELLLSTLVAFLGNTENSENDRRIGLIILVLIMPHVYKRLGDYIQAIVQLSQQVIPDEYADDELSAQVIEFWSTLCTKELEIKEKEEEEGMDEGNPTSESQQYIKLVLPALFSMICEGMVHQKEEDQYDEAWNLSTAAGTLLGLVSQVVGDDVLSYAVPFITKNINNTDWHYCEAAVTTVGGIVDGPDCDQFSTLLHNIIPVLIQKTIGDEHPAVVDSATWSLGSIAKYGKNFLLATHLRPLIEAMIRLLDNDNPRTAANAAWTIHNLAENVDEDDPTDYVAGGLDSFFGTLTTKLFEVTKRWDPDANLHAHAFEALSSLIRVAGSNTDRKEMLPRLLKEVGGVTGSVGLYTDSNERCTGLLSCVHALVVKLKEASAHHADEIMQICLPMLQKDGVEAEEAFNELKSEVLLLIGAVASVLKGDFEKYLAALMPLVIKALTIKDKLVMEPALGLVADTCRSVTKKILPFCDEIMTRILESLQDPTVPSDMKPVSISCCGDIALAIGGDFQKYLPVVATMLLQAVQAVETTPDLDPLRESIAEAFSGIIQGLSADNAANAFLPYITPVVNFVHNAIENHHLTKASLLALVGLIGDLAHTFGASVKNQICRPSTKKLLLYAGEYTEDDDEESTRVLKWTSSLVSQLAKLR